MIRDKDTSASYRPIANIPFLAKVIEKTVANQTDDYLAAGAYGASISTLRGNSVFTPWDIFSMTISREIVYA